MAAKVLAYPSASTQKGGDGELEHLSFQCGRTFAEPDLILNGDAFPREIDRILKIILFKVQAGGCCTSTAVGVTFSCGKNDSELSFQVEEFPEGGHRRPYFPCSVCHRNRSTFIPKSSRFQGTHPALIMETLIAEGKEIDNPSTISNGSFLNRKRELVSPSAEFPDGGHRCPYFPCPTCHRNRNLFAGNASESIEAAITNFDCKSDDRITSKSGDKMASHRACPTWIMYPDKGHKCEEFPCPICHKTRTG